MATSSPGGSVPTPYPHQLDGVRFLHARDGRALIADEPGLGKTGTTLLWLNERPELEPTVIVCPATMRSVWAREIKMWRGQSAFLPVGETPDPAAYAGQPFVIVHYDILAGDSTIDKSTHRIVVGENSWLAHLRALKPQCVVVDEGHLIKSTAAMRSKAVRALCRGVRHVIVLTGTPIVNRPVEAYNIVQLVARPEDGIPPWPTFTRKFCDPKHNGFAMNYGGAKNVEQLNSLLLKTVMLRRRKADVLDDLPAKVRQVVPLRLSNRGDYLEAENDYLNYVRQTEGATAATRAGRAEAITRINKLRGLAAAGKLDEAIEWIEDALETNGKLIVFAVRRSILDRLSAHFGRRSVRIDGDVPQAERGGIVDRFQSDPKVGLFLGQMQAAGVGITLTAASNVAFLEFPWTPVDLIQAEDRAHRIGQRDVVNVHYLVAEGTVDEQLMKLLDAKRAVIERLVDGEIDGSPTVLQDLLRGWRTA